MALNVPDLTGDNPSSGSKRGIPGGTTTTPGGSTSVPGSAAAAATPTSPQQAIQQRWRPSSLLSFHQDLENNPEQASRNLDAAIQRVYTNTATLESMIACTQLGVATITGSQLGIPTGLVSVKDCTGSIDNGATPHNFWLSVTPSQTTGAIDIQVSKPTANNNNTPIAATTAVKVRWQARGSLTPST